MLNIDSWQNFELGFFLQTFEAIDGTVNYLILNSRIFFFTIAHKYFLFWQKSTASDICCTKWPSAGPVRRPHAIIWPRPTVRRWSERSLRASWRRKRAAEECRPFHRFIQLQSMQWCFLPIPLHTIVFFRSLLSLLQVVHLTFERLWNLARETFAPSRPQSQVSILKNSVRKIVTKGLIWK